MLCCFKLRNHKYFAESLLHLFAVAIDHKGLLRGRWTLCPCVAYKQAKISCFIQLMISTHNA